MFEGPIGDQLREAREAAGLSIEDVAAHLRIRSNFLSALEDGRVEALPGTAYAIGYVRTYASFLRLDGDVAVQRFKQEAAGLRDKPELTFPSAAPEGKVPGGGVMLIAAVLAGVAYGGWYVLEERGISLDDLVPAVPERLAGLIDGQSGATARETSSIQVNPQAEAPAAEPAVNPVLPAGSSTPIETDYAAANPGSSGDWRRSATAEVQSAAPSQTVATPSVIASATPSATIVVEGSPAEEEPVAVTVEPRASTEAPTASTQSTAATQTSSSPESAPVDATPSQSAASLSEAPVEDRVATAATTDDAADAGNETAPVEVAEPASSTSVNSEGAVAAATVPAAPPAAPVVTLAPTDTPAVPGIPAAPTEQTAALPEARVLVRATGDSWVQIQDASGTTLFTRVLKEGDVYRVPDRDGLTLATGNAGTLDVVVDGEIAPSLGGFGDVVRNIALDPDLLRAGTAIGAGSLTR